MGVAGLIGSRPGGVLLFRWNETTCGTEGPVGSGPAHDFGPHQRGEKMNIGIIGSGHIGGTLTEKLATAGHNVGVANAHDRSPCGIVRAAWATTSAP